MNPKSIWYYRVKHDTGFAPNPFGSVCSLAACTPNHKPYKIQKDDWIIGFLAKSVRGLEEKFLYAMQVDEILNFDDYYASPKYSFKKPSRTGYGFQKCGDNIYFRNSEGFWQRDLSAFYHRSSEYLERDCKFPRVYLSTRYLYFGEKAVEIPAELGWIKRVVRGCWKQTESSQIAIFENWLNTFSQKGMIGQPIHFQFHAENQQLISVNSIFIGNGDPKYP